MKHKELTDKIINAFFKTYNKMGYGYMEKLYENALVIELKKLGLNVRQQEKIIIYYDGQVIGDYYADLVVQDLVICELKASEYLNENHEKQLLNYLRGTNLEVGLLLNFGEIPEVKRKVYDNDRKSWQDTRIYPVP